MGAGSKKMNVHAEGISCSGCAVDVETILRNTDGILKAGVSYPTGMINIEYNPKETGEDQIASLLKKLGLKTKPVDP